ncbi:MAG: sigma 54-interacting transcriptional regulator, partial [Alphaproteobacteria bacterium]|nr:sigma 54-interacting transcriptional regulator [Alphaproteobacteria bacterium]
DEITEMPLLMQAKLLRAIQEKAIDRVGGNQPVSVDIRIIATTNRDMRECVQKKQFREDLYYRLNVVTLSLPPLRKRPSDILPLAKHFTAKYAKLNQVPEKDLTPEAESALLSWGFQGNVRELENLMHRAVLLSNDTIQPEDIFGHDYAQANNQSVDDDAPIRLDGLIGKTLQDVEREMILSTLSFCTGKKNSAAEILGISIRALENKLKEYQQHT